MDVPPRLPFLLEHQQAIGVLYLFVTDPDTADVTTTRATSRDGRPGATAAHPIEPRRADEELSFMTAWELEALGQPTSHLRCRWCWAMVCQGQAGVSAARLPSEYWLELSDFWVCHAEVAIPLLTADVKAVRTRRLAGETHLLLHVDDVGDAVATVPAVRHADVGGGGGGGGGGDDDDDDGPEVVECRRCRAPLGTVVRDADATLRLHKDRLSLFGTMCDDKGVSLGTVGDWFGQYSALSRLWTELVDRASSHGQYRFILHAVDRATGTGDDLAATAPRARLRLLNWQSSVSWRATTDGAVVNDVPTLKVAYELYDDSVGGTSPAAMDRLREWHTSTPAQPIILLEEECQQALRVLRETHALLPTSAQTLKDMSIGFLPAVTFMGLRTTR